MATNVQGIPDKLFVTWHRNMRDRLVHAITDEEFAYGTCNSYGDRQAVCGTYVSVGHLSGGDTCPCCLAVIHVHQVVKPVAKRMGRVRRWCQRLRRGLPW